MFLVTKKAKSKFDALQGYLKSVVHSPFPPSHLFVEVELTDAPGVGMGRGGEGRGLGCKVSRR